jgi:hypothetical protein
MPILACALTLLLLPPQDTGKVTSSLDQKADSSMTSPLWQASLREHLSDDEATRTREIQDAAALFETCPGRRGR